MTEMALGMMISVMRGFGVQDRAMHRHGKSGQGPIGRSLSRQDARHCRPGTTRR